LQVKLVRIAQFAWHAVASAKAGRWRFSCGSRSDRFAADTAASTVCEIVIESATIVAILESVLEKKIVSASRGKSRD
jgi:hypothetical protein